MLAEAVQHSYTWDWTLWFEISTAVIAALLVMALIAGVRKRV